MARPWWGATAYSNSFGKPDATAMYNIDTGAHALLRQTAPNDGTNVRDRRIGRDGGGAGLAFDIATDAMGINHRVAGRQWRDPHAVAGQRQCVTQSCGDWTGFGCNQASLAGGPI